MNRLVGFCFASCVALVSAANLSRADQRETDRAAPEPQAHQDSPRNSAEVVIEVPVEPPQLDFTPVVFAVTRSQASWTYWVDPIVVLADGEWQDPIGDDPDGALAKWQGYYAGQPTLFLRKYNAAAGAVVAAPRALEFGFHVMGSARPTPEGSRPFQEGLGVTDSLLGGPVLAHVATEEEQLALFEAATASGFRHGIAEPVLQGLQSIDTALSVLGADGNQIALAGVFAAYTTTVMGGQRYNTGGSAILVVMKVGEDSAAVAYESLTRLPGGEGAVDLLDVIDLRQDGIPELILRVLGHEYHYYQILEHSRGSWRVAYEGGGGGM